jgi:putative ABC transport system substrate-binding protein
MARGEGANARSRRRFCGALASLLAAPSIATAEAAKVRRIGRLELGMPWAAKDVLEQAAPLRELGWVEGQNLQVERRYASSPEMLKPLAHELVQARVEIIVTGGAEATRAAMRATNIIPIVFRAASDPIVNGLVASLAHPGGNVTGFSVVAPEAQGKMLSLLKELLPGLRRIGVLEVAANPQFRLFRGEFERACALLDLTPIFYEIGAAGDIDSAVEQFAQQHAQALVLRPDNFINEHSVQIVSAALRQGLPTMASNDEFVVDAGALASYGSKVTEADRRAASFVDRILRGAKPRELPVEQPTQFEIAVNLKTARALGVTIPQSMLLRADKVIQ